MGYSMMIVLGCLIFCMIHTNAEICKDTGINKQHCATWAKGGYCTDPTYVDYMKLYCKNSCNLCPPVNPCTKKPCKNGGVCTNSGSSFKCSCVGGYSGNTCETVIPCAIKPCKNGGVCTNSGSSFKCSCVGGYSGNTCETDNCKDEPKYAAQCPELENKYCVKTSKYFQWMSINCKKTCDLCPKAAPKGGCGIKGDPTSRVIAGVEAKANTWVWQAGLYIFDGFACGGSLISDQWVLTAAHCLYRKESKKDYMDVILGDHERELDEGLEQKFRIGKIVIHPKYDSFNVINDIALIKLNKKVDMTKTAVGLICLPNQGEATSLDSECYITGWGRTKAGGDPSIVLMEAKLPPVSNAECSKQNNRYNGPQITKEMICGGDKPGSRKSGCQGDSGGPFVCTKDKKTWTLTGVVSWGSKDCDRSDKYTVFARVSLFRNWIDETMRKN